MLNRSERVLVAGAGGFVGGHLVRYLAAEGFTDIRAADIKPVDQWLQVQPEAECAQFDLRARAAAREAVAGCECVVNLTAGTGGTGLRSPRATTGIPSADVTATLLEAVVQAGVARFLQASSAAACPADLAGERLALRYQADHGLTVRIARYHEVYGPHCEWAGGRERAPAALSRKVAEAILAGADEIEIWGDGSQTRALLHVDDCVRGTLLILEGEFADPCNLGGAEPVSVNQLADFIEEIAGVRLKRRFHLSAPGGVHGCAGDGARMPQVPGWEPSVTLPAGLAGTYRWVAGQVSARTLTGRRGSPGTAGISSAP